MEKPITGKSVCRKWIFPILAVLLLIAILILWQYKKQETASAKPITTIVMW